LKKYKEVVEWAEKGISLFPEMKIFKTQKQTALEEIEKEKKRAAELLALKKSRLKIKKELEGAFKEKGIVMGDFLYPSLQQYLDKSRIYLDHETNQLHFPVLFYYPEFKQSDFIQDFCERDTFGDHLRNMFPGDYFCPWDQEKKYVFFNLEVYLITNASEALKKEEKKEERKQKKMRVRHETELLKVLKHREFVVPGLPVFWVVVKESKYKDVFLQTPVSAFLQES